MSRVPHRTVSALVVTFLGVGYALLSGGTVMSCLGPLGVTVVRCVAHGGRVPMQSPAVPMIGIAVAAGWLVAAGWPSVRTGIVGAAIGMGMGVAVYLATRETLLQGPDYDGTLLRVVIPIQWWLLGVWAIGGVATGMAVMSLIERVRERRAARRT